MVEKAISPSRLTGDLLASNPEGADAMKETRRRVPERKRDQYTPFGRVLDRLLEERGLSQIGLARKMHASGYIGYKKTSVREAISKGMNKGTHITFSLVEKIEEVLELNAEEAKELWDAAKETKRG